MNEEYNEKEILICIGAQKAGTTWLYKCLREHPMITSTLDKELHYFSNQINSYSTNEYIRKLNDTNPGKKLFECSTSYLSSPDAANNIKKRFPKAKIVAILRNPNDRLISHMNHLRSKGWSNCGDVKECVKNYPEIIENGLYGKHLFRYFKLFPKENVLVIFYEELENNPEKVFNRVCEHYDLEKYTPRILTKKYHSSSSRSHWAYMWIARRYRRNKNNSIFSFFVKTLKSIGIDSVLIDNLLKNKSKETKVFEGDTNHLFTKDLKKLKDNINQIPNNWM